MSTAAGKRYMKRVSELPCIACGAIGVHVHHLRIDRVRDDFIVCPLCPSCHTGAFSIHADKRQFTNIYGSEIKLLAKTIEALL